MNQLNGKRILVVEDEELLRELLADEFRTFGAEVIEAASGFDALEIIQSQDVDILFTDVFMPRVNGINLIKAIHSETEKRPKIFTWTGSRIFSPEEIQDLAILHCFEKPVDLARLIETISEKLAASA